MKTFKIAVIGGTGKSGSYLVKRLLENQHSLKILVRNPDHKIPDHPLVEIVTGDARDYETIGSLLSNCKAVLSTLGQPKGEPSIFSTATKNVIRAMRNLGVDRYIVTTGLNVDTPFDQKDSKVRFATDWMYANYPETTKDKQLEYEVLSQSGIRWTLVRLPRILQTDSHFPVTTSLENCPGESISALDLADFLISQLTDDSFTGKSPFLANV